MKTPKYGIICAVAITALYIFYILYSLISGNVINRGEITTGVIFVLGIITVIIFEYKHKDDDNTDADN